MQKKLLLISLILLVSCTPQIKEVQINNIKIPVELATTPEQRGIGLMGRTNITGGMLFIFEDEQQRLFWMKDTLIPLDMIFINKDLEITKIHHAVPCIEDPCSIYPGNAEYVLEVNYNFTINNDIKEGEKVKLLG